MTQWSTYQEAIFDAVEDSSQGNLLVQARAGSGKTTTIVEACGLVDEYLQVLLCAFNKRIQVELAARIDAPNVTVKTLHALGYGACFKRLGKVEVEGNKVREIVKAIAPEIHSCFKGNDDTAFEARGALIKLVSFIKNVVPQVPNDDLIDTYTKIAYGRQLESEAFPGEIMGQAAAEILKICADPHCREVSLPDSLTSKIKSKIDFDDMIWLPAAKGYPVKQFDVVFVDECQDLNPTQFKIVEMAIGHTGRFIGVGDRYQAIYQFRGAGDDVMAQLRDRFEATEVTLPITYRCPLSVVNYVKSHVPDFEPRQGAPEGIVKHSTDMPDAQPGDFVLSRTNAPLISLCLEYLKQQKPATVVGRDIGAMLGALLKKSGSTTVGNALKWLDSYQEKEVIRLTKKDQLGAIEMLQDKCAAVVAICEGLDDAATISEAHARIENIFGDKTYNGMINLSTAHRAKGLEAKTVWLLDNFGRNGAEGNVWYVAATRALERLVICEGVK